MTTAHDDHDFRRFAGRFDQPVAPSSAFTDGLRRRLATGQDRLPVPVQPVTIQMGQPVPAARAMDDPPWQAPRWMRTIEAAVAVLLVLSLAGASLYYQQPAAVYDLAFQPATETVRTEYNFGGNAGRTWVLGDVEPEMGGFRQDPDIDLSEGQFGGPNPSSILIDDSYIFTVSGLEEDQLVRYDLDNHARAWTIPIYVTGSLASDGERIFAMRSDRMISTDTATLVAIDFQTGEIAWEGPELANHFHTSSSLVLTGDTISVTDYLGNVVAANKDDGTQLWQYPETLAAPSVDEEFISIAGPQFYANAQIGANDSAVFLSRPSKAIQSLDRETGEELGTINLVDDYGADIIGSLIQVRDQQLVITALQAPRSEDLEAIRDFMPSSILLFDATTLELQFRTETFDFRGSPIVTPESIYVPSAPSVEDNASLYRLDPATGKLSEPIAGVSSRWDIDLSASGNVLMATGDPSTIAFFDLDTGELLDSVELGITNMETPFGQPVQMWGANPIVITGLGEVYVIENDPGN